MTTMMIIGTIFNENDGNVIANVNMNKEGKTKILIAMSGGVDSSVAAALLVNAKKYEVAGMFAVNFDEKNSTKSCWRDDYQDALRTAAKLGIPLLRWDFTREYKEDVIEYMRKEYLLGRTPNPDVLCNKFVKFGAWLKRAQKEGYDFIATGHYAQINKKIIKQDNLPVVNYSLLIPKDENKDQTYFLHQLSQKQLANIIFPLGKYTKPQVRALAKKFDLPTADKCESMGICFIGERPMKEFLKEELKIKAISGKIILSNGQEVGYHSGLPFYTIGERVGINLKTNLNKSENTKPLFVVDKKNKENILVVGFENDSALYKKEIIVGNLNWINDVPKFPFKCMVRLRHRQNLAKCILKQGKLKTQIIVEFDKQERAVTPGQFAVFYKNKVCLGGGVII